MTDETTRESELPRPQPVQFGERLAGSETFKDLFREGMSMVEETAAYLDGPGRDESKDISRTASLTYATESMRLTTRLMQMASWLLLQRAVNEGEMTAEQAGLEQAKVKLETLSTNRDGDDWQALPQRLKDLIDQSIRLQDRIRHLDESMYNKDRAEEADSPNPVASQLDHLARALNADGPATDD